MARGTCAYCRGVYNSIDVHESTCVMNPDVDRRTRAFLHERAQDGVIMPVDEYRRQAQGLDLPARSRLTMHYGGWPQVAEHFGLRVPRRRKNNECPHCHQLFTPVGLEKHLAQCPENAEVKARVVAFLREISQDGKLPTVQNYIDKRQELQAQIPSHARLMTAYGSWSKTAEALGFEPRIQAIEYNRDFVWTELQRWYEKQEPPALGRAWDSYVEKKQDLPPRRIILEKWGVTWADIVDEFSQPPSRFVTMNC